MHDDPPNGSEFWEARDRKSVSPSRTAARYSRGLWECPELELSNNLAETSMRPVALRRKNWVEVGSPQAGPKLAAIFSVVETCRNQSRFAFGIGDVASDFSTA
jgi:hypothetical protein